jgi:hypothetical protein
VKGEPPSHLKHAKVVDKLADKERESDDFLHLKTKKKMSLCEKKEI